MTPRHEVILKKGELPAVLFSALITQKYLQNTFIDFSIFSFNFADTLKLDSFHGTNRSVIW